MDSSMADQLHFIDQQLLQCELSPGDEAAVDEFTVWSLQFRQQRHNSLGHFPDDMVERSAWQAKKQRLDESMEPEIESERLLRGLTQVWEKHQERERLRELRGHLLEGSSSGLSGPASSLTHRQAVPGMVHHVSGPSTQRLRQQVQPDQGLLTQQHFMQPEHALLLSQQLQQQPMSVLPGLTPSMPSPCPPLQLMQAQSALPVGSSDSQHSQLGPQLLPGASEPSTSYSRQDPAPTAAQEVNQQKVCRICHEVKSLADYHRNKVNADGHNSMCKTCAAEYDKEKRRRRQRVHEPTLTEKECPHCKKIKAAEGFYRYSLSQDGLYNICKVCHADQAKARQEAKAGMCPPAEKVCSSCRLTKPSTEFYTNKTAADMLHSLCKQCHGDKCRSRASGNYDVSVVDKVNDMSQHACQSCSLHNQVQSRYTLDDLSINNMNMSFTDTYKHAAGGPCTCTELCPCMQHCRSCGQVKASDEFPRNRMNKDGLHSYCKPCQNAKCAQYQRNSLAAKQEGKPVAESPADVALPDEPFPSHKECKACHEAKPLSEYYRSVTNRDGLVSKCKRCMAQSNQRKLTEPTVGEKRCSECGEHKPASQFYKNRTNKDGLFGKCKLCSEGTKKERALNDVTVERKVCKSCGEEKAASDFTRYRMRRDGLYNWCKQCDIWKRQERRKRKRDEAYTMTGGMMQGQGMHDDGSMDPDDDLAGDDGKSDDMTNVVHGAHAHMHSIPHNPHQMGQPVPGGLPNSYVTGLQHQPNIMQMVSQ